MNNSEEEHEEKKEELQLVSFDEYMTSIEAEAEAEKEETLKDLETTDARIQDVKDGSIFLLKQLKSCVEQIDFLRVFKDKYNLKDFLVRSEETFDRFLVDFAIFQETNFDLLQTIQKEKQPGFLPKTVDFIFLEPKKFEKHLLKKKKITLQGILRQIRNTELCLSDKMLERERNKPIIQKDIIAIKGELGRGDIRLKKVKKVAPGLSDVLNKFETQRIVQISMLIYYYYRLSNEDVEIDKGLSKVFPEIEEAQKKLDDLEKELKKNDADNRSEETIAEEKSSKKKTT